jgi:hypothetical protein
MYKDLNGVTDSSKIEMENNTDKIEMEDWE